MADTGPGIVLTLLLGVSGICLAAFSDFMARRILPINRLPKMIPWRLLSILFVFGALLMLVHLINLMGYETGNVQRRF
jgi:hypothetical protein